MVSLMYISDEVRENEWFRSLPEVQQKALVENSEMVRLKPGEFLFRQGDAPNGFYGIHSGQVKISTVRADGKEAILSILASGNWFGHCSMIDRGARAHNVMAISPVVVLAVRTLPFELLMQSPAFARGIARLQTVHLNWLYRVIEDATLYSTRARIARRLLLLMSIGSTAATRTSRMITIQRDMLAMMLGISRQTLSLELKALAGSGAITLRYGHIEICSEEILSSFQ